MISVTTVTMPYATVYHFSWSVESPRGIDATFTAPSHNPPLRRGTAEADLGGHCTKESAHEIGNTQAHEPGGIMEIY
jgi:hypothetical protein